MNMIDRLVSATSNRLISVVIYRLSSLLFLSIGVCVYCVLRIIKVYQIRPIRAVDLMTACNQGRTERVRCLERVNIKYEAFYTANASQTAQQRRASRIRMSFDIVINFRLYDNRLKTPEAAIRPATPPVVELLHVT